MKWVDSRIVWAPRVPPARLRRLYQGEAAGRLDEALVDEVAYAFAARAADILTASRAHAGEATCPVCAAVIRHDWDKAALLACACGWAATWGAYFASFQKKQLMAGGSERWIREYLSRLRAATSPRARLLAIDWLIHQYHWGMRHPDRSAAPGPRGQMAWRDADGQLTTAGPPGRPTATNFIRAKASDVLAVLDELGSYGAPAGADPSLRAGFAVDRRAAAEGWGRG